MWGHCVLWTTAPTPGCERTDQTKLHGKTTGPHLGQPVLRVHVHRLPVLDRAIVARALQLGGIEEEAGCQRLFYGVVVLWVADHVDFDALHEPHQLVPHVARPLH